MVEEGERAPRFELPATVDGEFERVALEESLGREVVVLAFYPADFNPACTDGTTDLDAFEVLRMQRDVSVRAVSGDSVYSHRAFAEEYDLGLPLLSDVRGRVAEAYGLAADDERYPTRRGVVVVDHAGTVAYAWAADDPEELPDVDAVRAAVEDIGSGQFARTRYRVGHARYTEGRRLFTSAMHAFEEGEWLPAKRDFRQAHEEFTEAAAEFDTVRKFGEAETATAHAERAASKATALWQAAEWLADAASAFRSGEGGTGESMRADAETPLEAARALREPPDPDEFPPEDLPPEAAGLPDVSVASGADGKAGDTQGAASDPRSGATTADDRGGENDESGEIDDEELAEIAAELERQTEAAREADENDTPGVDEDEQDHEAGDGLDGDHGVPDSL